MRQRAGATLLRAFLLLATVMIVACGGKPKTVAPPATFTPVPSPVGARAPLATPVHPVVSQNCLRGLSSYKFSGNFSLHAATPSPTSAAAGEQGLTGSLANLLSDVSFQGSALAPDRYQAQVSFGGNGVQSLQLVRIGAQTYSRFGNGAWQQGDQIEGLGGIAQFDPETLCQNSLTALDAGSQTPARETVNGVPSLRYEISGPQAARALTGGGRGATVTPAPGLTAPSGLVTAWEAEQGGYPVRFQVNSMTSTGAVNLLVNVTDVNGKDIQINAPG
jgi:hypothetical protein